MTKLDKQFLKDIGIKNIDDNQAKGLLEDIGKTLELRVGMAISATLDDDTLASVKESDEMDAAWLDKHVPDYKNLVEGELNKLKQEFIDDAKKLTQS